MNQPRFIYTPEVMEFLEAHRHGLGVLANPKKLPDGSLEWEAVCMECEAKFPGGVRERVPC